MNKQILKSAFAALTLSSLLLACKKDTPAEPDCSLSLNGLAGKYKLTKMQYKRDASAPEVDYLQFMDDCEKDDVVELKNNGTYTYTDGGTVCDPNGNDTGTWSISGNTINGDGTVDGTVSSYDCKTLVYYGTSIYLPGDKMTFTITKQ